MYQAKNSEDLVFPIKPEDRQSGGTFVKIKLKGVYCDDDTRRIKTTGRTVSSERD